MLRIELSDGEAETLRGLLHDWLPALRMEVARTDAPARELRHLLVQRQEVCERILAELERAGP